MPSKGLWGKTKKFFRNTHTFLRDHHIPSTVMQYMPFAPIRNLAPIVRRIDIGLIYGADDDDGPSSVTRIKGGKLIPPGSFYEK